MQRNNGFKEQQTKNIEGVIRNAKELYNNNRREFYRIATKISLGFLFFINLFIPYYSYYDVFGDKVGMAIGSLSGAGFYIITFFALIVIYGFNAFNGEKDKAEKTFKLHTILAIIMFFRLFSVFSTVVTNIFTATGLSLGFFLDLILIVLMALMAWNEHVVMDFVYKFFKISDIQEVDYIKKNKPKTQEKEETPVKVVKQEFTKEPEPVVEVEVEPVVQVEVEFKPEVEVEAEPDIMDAKARALARDKARKNLK